MLPGSAALFDFFTHPQARGKGLYQAAMQQMLHDASCIPNTSQVYISVMADNVASRHAIEKIGFKYKCSLYGRK
jgi:RimJ/RimL family protein N-acetyltransferase